MFTIINQIVQPLPETLLIPEFQKLWDRDNSKTKSTVIKEFSFIYFVEDFKSPYKKGLSGEELISKVTIDLFEGNKWKEDNLVNRARLKYRELNTTHSVKLLESAEKAVKEITDYFNNFNLASISDDKKHIAVKNTINNIQELDDLTQKLQSTKQRILREMDAVKMAGKRVLGKRELPPNKRQK
jgi:hypothetical protein